MHKRQGKSAGGSRDLLIINEASDIPTFETNRGHSWIDLTLSNNIVAQKTRGWTCGKEDSCADYKIIFFEIESTKASIVVACHPEKRYLTKADKWGTFVNELMKNLLENFNCRRNTNDLTTSNSALSQKASLCSDTEAVIHKIISAITVACEAKFQIIRRGKCATKERSVPWWTSDLTLLRKKALALRHRYQRMKNDDNLQHERRTMYLECNRLYQAKLREQRLKSWKDFCSSIESSNPWNAVYRYTAGKLCSKPTLSTLKASNNNYTADIQSTVNQLMEYFLPEDNKYSDRTQHKRARQQMKIAMHTPDDNIFTEQEIQAVLEKFDPCKAPGEDALHSEVLLHAFRSFPILFTQIYNECLRKELFPKQWK